MQEEKPETVEKTKRKPKEKVKEESKKRVVVVEPTNVVEVVYDDSAPQGVEDEADTEKAPMTDQEWLRARTSRTLGLVSDSEDSDVEGDPQSDNESLSSDESSTVQKEESTPVTPPETSPSDTAPRPAENKSTAESKILKTGRLFIRNLVYGITEADLREIFSPYGPLSEVFIPIPFFHHSETMMIKRMTDRDNRTPF
jgi:RNA recognition motif-containing protein